MYVSKFEESKQTNNMTKSIFLKKQGTTPKNKVLDFLITYSELDYSLKEISDYSGAGYSTIKLLIKRLEKDKWIIPTRKISKIVLYKLNTENPEVKRFIDFYWEVIDSEVRHKNTAKSKKEITESSRYMPSVGMAVSARNI